MASHAVAVHYATKWPARWVKIRWHLHSYLDTNDRAEKEINRKILIKLMSNNKKQVDLSIFLAEAYHEELKK